MIVKRTQPILLECVVRGYISGGGWKDYRTTGSVCGIQLPDNLVESDKLPEPIYRQQPRQPLAMMKVLRSPKLHKLLDVASQIQSEHLVLSYTDVVQSMLL